MPRTSASSNSIASRGNELKSIGFNAEWHVTDNFSLALDVHDFEGGELAGRSRHRRRRNAVQLRSARAEHLRSAQREPLHQSLRANLPVQRRLCALAQRTLYATPRRASRPPAAIRTTRSRTTTLAASTCASTIRNRPATSLRRASTATWKFDNDSRVQFGVETRAMESRQRASNAQMTLGDWGVARPGELPANLLQPFSLVGSIRRLHPRRASRARAGKAMRMRSRSGRSTTVRHAGAMPARPMACSCYNPAFDQDHTVSEDTVAAYVQYGMNFDLFSRHANSVGGRALREDRRGSGIQPDRAASA